MNQHDAEIITAMIISNMNFWRFFLYGKHQISFTKHIWNDLQDNLFFKKSLKSNLDLYPAHLELLNSHSCLCL